MRVVIRGRELPGRRCGPHDNVHVGLQAGRDVTGLVPGDAAHAEWVTAIDCGMRNDVVVYRGSAVHGRPGEQFLYLTWGEVDGDDFAMFRRAKLMLSDLGPEVLHAALVTATVDLTDESGMPRCARVRPPAITWELSR